MARALKLTTLAALWLTIFAWPAGAQNQQPANKPAPATAPVVDPNAAAYSSKPIYVPPGAVKSVEIGNFYLRRKKYKGALSRFKEAVAEDSSYAPAYLGMGKVYEHIGLKQKALAAYQQYLDNLPSEKDALEAKSVRRAMARLQHQVKAPGPRPPRRSSKAEAALPPSQ
ncbi:MAG TPA: tetratricopeptide repeat protein [Terriglobia bacterium]|nr:tetratricopeptide repeat protein [Terriglobia bacterium]